MELDEIKNQWEQLSAEIKKQKILTDKIIIEMTQERFNNQVRKIWIPEFIGTIVCVAIALVIVFNFGKLNTWYLMVSGTFSVIYLLVLPLAVLQSLTNMRKINLRTTNLKDTVLAYAKAKKQFWRIQKTGFYANFIFIVAILLVFGKLLGNKDVMLDSHIFYYLPIMAIFLIVFSKWGFKQYKKATNNAEKLLEEFEINNSN